MEALPENFNHLVEEALEHMIVFQHESLQRYWDEMITAEDAQDLVKGNHSLLQ